MIGADDLVVKIGADFSGLTGGLNKAGSEVKKFSSDSSKGVKELGDAVGLSVAKFGIYVDVIKQVSNALISVVTDQVKYATELDRLSSRLGISNEKFSQMATVVKSVGANQQDLYEVIKNLGNKIQQADEGNVQYQKSLDRIGLSYHMLSMLSPEQQLYYFADGLKRASAEAQKLSLDELVSDPGMRMIDVLNKGSDSLQKMMKSADDAGQSLKTADFAQFKELEDTFIKTGNAAFALGTKIAKDLTPSIKWMSEQVQDSIRGWDIIITKMEETYQAFQKIKKEMADKESAAKNTQVFEATSSDAIMLPKVAGYLVEVEKNANDAKQQIAQFNDSLKENVKIVEAMNQPNFDLTATYPAQDQGGEDKVVQGPSFGPENIQVQKDALEQAMLDYQDHRERIGTMQADYNAQMYQDEKRNQEAHRLLWASSWKGKAKITSEILDNLSTLMNSKSRKMFEIGKVAAISGAIIDTISSAQKSYNAMAGIPYVGPALGAAAAAAAILAGGVRIQQIQSTNFGSSGGPGNGAGPGVAGTPQPAEVIQQTNVDVSLQGSNFSGDQVRGLISSINGAISDGAKLNSITVK